MFGFVGQKTRCPYKYAKTQQSSRGETKRLCRCDCGTERYVLERSLLYGGSESCGCQKKEHDQLLSTFLARVDGTCLDHLRSKKIPSSNTTGVRGVYLIRGKYMAKIVIQQKQYQLGTYKTLEEAAQIRKDAEAVIDEQILQHYDKWLARAQADLAWGAAHPVHYDISKRGSELEIVAEPPLREIQNAQPEIPGPVDIYSLRQGKEGQEARVKKMRRCSYQTDDSTPSPPSLAPEEKETAEVSSTGS